KDSLYNEYRLPDGSYRSIPGTLLITAVGMIPDVRRAVTMDLKEPGNPIYAVGYTRCELGGSCYYSIIGVEGGAIPSVDLKNAKLIMDRIVEAIDLGYVKSCHDCSEGGLAVALAESSFSGGFGVEVWLSEIPRLDLARDDKILFSESNSRFIVEVMRGREDYFEEVFCGLPCRRIGYTTSGSHLVIHGLDGRIYEEDIWRLKGAWKSTFNW
ncbi:MAG: AIR synthase-related protein, partial [Candidatus Bathyarchaeia archaeon]